MNKLTTALILSGLLGLYFVVQAMPPSVHAPAASNMASTTVLGTLVASQAALAGRLQGLSASVTQLERSAATRQPAPAPTTQTPLPAATSVPHAIIPPAGGFDDEGYDD